jgi:hypothetical protein
VARGRWRWWIAGVFAAAVAAFVLVWFQPQKLVIDEQVSDPLADATGNDVTELAVGDFGSLDHTTTGRVRVIESADGSRVVRLEGLATSNGPDLFVYLSANPSDGPESAFDDDYINLGRLKGNEGDQNYELGRDVDLDRFPTVVVWCDRFDSAFGAAPLSPLQR